MTDFVKSLRDIFPDKDEAILQEILGEFRAEDKDILDKAVSRVLSLNETDGTPVRKKRHAIVMVVDDEDSTLNGTKKPISPEVIFAKIEELQASYPDLNPDLIYHRLEAASDLDETVKSIRKELDRPQASPAMSVDDEDVPGPSHRKSPGLPPPVIDLDESNIAGPSQQQPPSAILDFLSEEERAGVAMVIEMFPKVDPYYVMEKVARERMPAQDLVEELTRDSGYPKLRDRIDKENKEKRRSAFLSSRKFDPGEFLKLFPDPLATFVNVDRPVSSLYAAHAQVRIHNEFPHLKCTYLDQTLASVNNHYYPAYIQIQGDLLTPYVEEKKTPKRRQKRSTHYIPPKKKGKKMKDFFGKKLREQEEWPNEIDEGFFRELQFRKFESTIQAHQDHVKKQKERRREEATKNGEFQECGCCFCDNILPEDVRRCSLEIHGFCTDCVTQHAKVQVGDEGKNQVRCMDEKCEGEFLLDVLRELLEPKMLNRLYRMMREDELKKANIENMESCPHCEFSLIIENKHERVFKCQNPECLKESCRSCKEESHIPLRCDEVEKSCEVRMRTFVENAMAEAMIRVCPKCGKRIIKSEGCNKMACPCGCYICYVCGEKLSHNDPYSHFGRGKGKCPQTSALDQLHADVAEKAGKDARKKFLGENPEMAEKKVEVEKLVDRQKETIPGGIPPDHHIGYEDDSDDSWDEDDEEDHPFVPHFMREAVAAADRRMRDMMAVYGVDQEDLDFVTDIEEEEDGSGDSEEEGSSDEEEAEVISSDEDEAQGTITITRRRRR